jgi:hypothetical protein
MGFGAMSTTIHRPRWGVVWALKAPHVLEPEVSYGRFTAPPEGRALEASHVHYASPCMQLCS